MNPFLLHLAYSKCFHVQTHPKALASMDKLALGPFQTYIFKFKLDIRFQRNLPENANLRLVLWRTEYL